MAIAFDAASSAGNKEVTSLTWSHTCSGADRLLIVTPGSNNAGGAGPAPSYVTYNGTTLTWLLTQQSGVTLDMWYAIAPATGANNITVVYPTAPKFMSGTAVSFTGVDQTTPVNANAQGGGTPTPINRTIAPTELNSMIVDGISGWKSSNLVPGTSQTEAVDNVYVDAETANSYWQVSLTGTVTVSWSHDGTTIGLGVLALTPAAGGGGGGSTWFEEGVMRGTGRGIYRGV